MQTAMVCQDCGHTYEQHMVTDDTSCSVCPCDGWLGER